MYDFPDIKEYRGIIEHDHFIKLKEMITSVDFPWHYLPDTTFENGRKKGESTPAFAHLLFSNDGKRSDYLDHFTPIINNLVEKEDMKLNNIIRMRLGFLMNTRYNLPSMPYAFNEPHLDCEFPHLTAVMYFDDNDGDTVIFGNKTPPDIENGERWHVSDRFFPEANKIILFDGLRYHASTCPKIQNSRIALTINFTAEY